MSSCQRDSSSYMMTGITQDTGSAGCQTTSPPSLNHARRGCCLYYVLSCALRFFSGLSLLCAYSHRFVQSFARLTTHTATRSRVQSRYIPPEAKTVGIQARVVLRVYSNRTLPRRIMAPGTRQQLIFATVVRTVTKAARVRVFHSISPVWRPLWCTNSLTHCSASIKPGTSLNIYCILVLSDPSSHPTNLSVNLDNDYFYYYRYPGQNSSTYTYKYNVSIFSHSALSNTEHTVTMTALQGTSASTLLFDYATYT